MASYKFKWYVNLLGKNEGKKAALLRINIFFIRFIVRVLPEEKGWLKNEHSKNEDHGIWPHYFITNRWETIETVRDFLFLGAKITADGDCSHEIKRLFLLGRKAMINLDSTLKSRDISLPTKVRLIKAIVFPVVMDGCESWTIKKVEHRRIDAFSLWC